MIGIFLEGEAGGILRWGIIAVFYPGYTASSNNVRHEQSWHDVRAGKSDITINAESKILQVKAYRFQ